MRMEKNSEAWLNYGMGGAEDGGLCVIHRSGSGTVVYYGVGSMKIRKHGETPEIVRFECDFCGCVFECERGEYNIKLYEPYEPFDHHYPQTFFKDCPECGNECIWRK